MLKWAYPPLIYAYAQLSFENKTNLMTNYDNFLVGLDGVLARFNLEKGISHMASKWLH